MAHVTIKIVHSFHRLVYEQVEKYSTLEKLARLVTRDKPGVPQRIFTGRNSMSGVFNLYNRANLKATYRMT